jgi:hypothetical protein
MIDAAILYIYGDPATGIRVTDYDELTEIAGVTRQHLVNTKNHHKWENFRLDMIGEKFQKRNAGELGFLGKSRSPEELQRIKDERQRQLDEIPDLEKQASKIKATLSIIPATDKSYSSLVTTLDRITKMLADRTGLTDRMLEEDEIRKALIRIDESRAKTKTSKPQGHDAIDHSKVIDALPA